MRRLTAATALVFVFGCETAPGRAPAPTPTMPTTLASGAPHDATVPQANASATPPGGARDVRVDTVRLEGSREAFVLRGARGEDRIVFLHGLCGHGMGYLQSFQFAAARHGLAVAPNGDVACSGPWRSWSGKLDSIEQQIENAFAAAGGPDPHQMTLIGYSLGATRAQALAAAHKDRYDALVLIAAPAAPSPNKLGHLRAAAMMAGSRDRKDAMKLAVKSFQRAGIPSRFFELPGAAHGEMGPEAERVMGEVLDWVDVQPRKP